MGHLQANGFKVQKKDVFGKQFTDVKSKHGVPSRLHSCHTAVIDGYIIEGHVPADLIKRMLKERPPIVGLAVPGPGHGPEVRTQLHVPGSALQVDEVRAREVPPAAVVVVVRRLSGHLVERSGSADELTMRRNRDRLDALVWALTELSERPRHGPRIRALGDDWPTMRRGIARWF